MILGLVILKDKPKVILITMFFILCPLTGMLCFALSALVYKLKFTKHIDVTGIYFNDEKLNYQRKEDYREGIDVAPLEEVLRVSGVKEKRRRLLNSIKSDIGGSLSTYSSALLSTDSEVSHYAAAMLSNVKDTYDRNLNRLAHEFDIDREDLEINKEYIRAEQEYLTCGIQLTDDERLRHLYSFTNLCENLYTHHPDKVTEDLFDRVISYFIELNEYSKAQIWISNFEKTFPKNELVYLSKLRFYFHNNDSEMFFTTLSQLKSSGIPISASSIDLIRYFNQSPILKRIEGR